MSNEDFFKKVDAKLRKESATDDISQETAGKDRDFIRHVIAKVTPIAVSYQEKLKERGFDTKLDKSPTRLTFTLTYKDGCRNELHVGSLPKSGLIELNTLYIEDNQTYAATKSYNSERWQDVFFEDRLQRLVENFMLYAEKHDGI